MPKVLRIINRFNLGGPTYNVAYLTKYMAPEYETLLIGGVNDKTEANSEFIPKSLGINPIIIPEIKRTLNPINDIIAYNKIKKIIKDFKPDIVHTHASKSGALGRKAAFDLNIPVVIHTFHGFVFDAYFNNIKSCLYKKAERILAKKTTKIIAVSENQKQDLIYKYHICEKDKIKVIPLGFDLNKFQENMELKREKFRIKYKINDNEIAIGIIGRLVPIKNHQLFIKALKYVSDNSNKKIRAFIIGDGEENANIKDKAKELDIDFTDYNIKPQKSILTFTSWIKDIDFVMAGMDIITLTSLNEGTPVSLIEAQAANKPVVSTNVGGIEDVVIPNQTALLSDIKEEHKFLQNLLSVVEDDDLRNNLSEKGWDTVKNKFNYIRLINDMKNLYNNLLN